MPQPKELMRGFMALLAVAAFQWALFWLFIYEVPEANRDLITYMLGQLSGFAGAAFIFYFGTTKSSADKTAVIHDLTRERIFDDEPDDFPPPPTREERELPHPTFGEKED